MLGMQGNTVESESLWTKIKSFLHKHSKLISVVLCLISLAGVFPPVYLAIGAGITIPICGIIGLLGWWKLGTTIRNFVAELSPKTALVLAVIGIIAAATLAIFLGVFAAPFLFQGPHINFYDIIFGILMPTIEAIFAGLWMGAAISLCFKRQTEPGYNSPEPVNLGTSQHYAALANEPTEQSRPQAQPSHYIHQYDLEADASGASLFARP